MSFIYYFFIVLFMFLCLLLCCVILIQESKSMGLGSSFQPGGSSDSLFGASTPQVLKKFTAILATIFLISCVILSFWTSSMGRQKMVAPAVTIEEASS